MTDERTNKPSSTTPQLRDDIDSGRTGDKVAHPDPAAAPLGTDDEAAGTPPTTQRTAQARREEQWTPSSRDRIGNARVRRTAISLFGIVIAGLAAGILSMLMFE